MRIVLVHNHYGSSAPSGENNVFQLEKKMLESKGHEVLVYERFSDEIRSKPIWGEFKGAITTPWNFASSWEVSGLVRRFRPDILHAHNTFPLISPSIFSSAKGVGRVLTLHNYRLFCPSAIPMLNGKVCTQCLDRRSVIPSLKHACYRGSRLATLPLALNVALHRFIKTWEKNVDAFIALTKFQKRLMVDAGLLEERVFVKPNYYPGFPESVSFNKKGDYAVFVGRLSREKGVLSLIKAWRLWGDSAPELRIVGEGEMRAELEALSIGLPIKFMGQVSESKAQEQIKFASLLILPSEWFEGFPMVFREAFAFGTPVATSNIGPLPSIVEDGRNGVIFRSGDPDSLLTVVRDVWAQKKRLEVMAQGARATFEENYTETINYQQLIGIYERAMQVRQGRK